MAERNKSSLIDDGWQRAQAYAPPNVATFARTLTTRFGHSRQFSHLLSTDAELRQDYRTGLAAFLCLLLTIFAAWGTALIYLHVRIGGGCCYDRRRRRLLAKRLQSNIGGCGEASASETATAAAEESFVTEDRSTAQGTGERHGPGRLRSPGVFRFDWESDGSDTGPTSATAYTPRSPSLTSPMNVDAEIVQPTEEEGWATIEARPELRGTNGGPDRDASSVSMISTLTGSTRTSTLEGAGSLLQRKSRLRSHHAQRHRSTPSSSSSSVHESRSRITPGGSSRATETPGASVATPSTRVSASGSLRSRKRRQRAIRRRIQDARATTVCIGVVLCASTIVILLFALPPMRRASTALQKGIADSQDVVSDAASVAASFNMSVSDFAAARQDFYTWVDGEALCPSASNGTALGLNIAAISQSMTNSLNGFDSFVGSGGNQTSGVWTGWGSGTQQAVEILDTVSGAVSRGKHVAWIVPTFLLMLCVSGAAVVAGSLWEGNRRKSTAKRAEGAMKKLIIPGFIVFVSACIVALLVVSLGSMINNDACMGGQPPGSPNATAVEVLHEIQLDEFNPHAFDVVVAYAEGCAYTDPLGTLLKFEREMAASVDIIWDILIQINEIGVREFSIECGNGLENAFEAAWVLANSIDAALVGIQRAEETLQCGRIIPIYINAVNNALCSDMAYGMSLSFVLVLIVSVCGLSILSLRCFMRSQRAKLLVRRDPPIPTAEHDEYLSYISQYKHEWDEYPGIDSQSILSDMESITDVVTVCSHNIKDIERSLEVDGYGDRHTVYEGSPIYMIASQEEEEEGEEGMKAYGRNGVCPELLYAIDECEESNDKNSTESYEEDAYSREGYNNDCEEKVEIREGSLGRRKADSYDSFHSNEESISYEEVTDYQESCSNGAMSSFGPTMTHEESTSYDTDYQGSCSNGATSSFGPTMTQTRSSLSSNVDIDELKSFERISWENHDEVKEAMPPYQVLSCVSDASLNSVSANDCHEEMSFSSQIEGHAVRCAIRGIFEGMDKTTSLEEDVRDDSETREEDTSTRLGHGEGEGRDEEHVARDIRTTIDGEMSATVKTEARRQSSVVVRRAAVEYENKVRESVETIDPHISGDEVTSGLTHRRTQSDKLRQLIEMFETLPLRNRSMDEQLTSDTDYGRSAAPVDRE